MRKSILIITILSFIFSACNSQNNIDKLGQEGVQLFEKGDIKGAHAKFEKIIEIDDRNAEAHLKKADCLDILGDIQGSIESYSRAIEIDTMNKTAFYNRALSYEKIGDFKNALADYQKAIDVDSQNKSELNNKLIYHNLGIVYGRKNQLGKAIEAFSNAIEIDKNYADAYFNRGYAYQLKDDHEKAISNFDKAIEINPTNPLYKASKDISLIMKE